jgi:hypothetical protein
MIGLLLLVLTTCLPIQTAGQQWTGDYGRWTDISHWFIPHGQVLGYPNSTSATANVIHGKVILDHESIYLYLLHVEYAQLLMNESNLLMYFVNLTSTQIQGQGLIQRLECTMAQTVDLHLVNVNLNITRTYFSLGVLTLFNSYVYIGYLFLGDLIVLYDNATLIVGNIRPYDAHHGMNIPLFVPTDKSRPCVPMFPDNGYTINEPGIIGFQDCPIVLPPVTTIPWIIRNWDSVFIACLGICMVICFVIYIVTDA